MNSMDLVQRRRNGQLGWPIIPIPPTTTTYNPGSSTPTVSTTNSSGGTQWDGMQIFNNISSLVSQIVAGWSHNPTNQVYNGVGVVGNPGVLLAQAQNQPPRTEYPQGYAANSAPNPNANNGGIGEDFFGSITGLISKYPLPIAAVVLGAVLFLRDPKKK